VGQAGYFKNESISVTYTDADVLDKIDAHGETINTHQPATPQYLAREIHDIVTNPWVAYDLSEALLKRLVELSSEETVQHNLYKVTNWFRTQLYQVREDLSYNIFDKLLKSEEIRFVFFKDSWHPSENKFAPSTGKRLTTDMGDKMQHSLFEAESVLEGEFNTYEKQVAFLLDGHLKLYFWHRNHSNKNVDYFLQGWRQHRIFPDFLATQKDPSNDDSYDKVFIIETKGDHLQESKDINIHDRTGYIKKLFEQCNTVKPTHLTELGLEMKGKQVRFEVVYQSEFPSKLEALFR
jgi:hypothetical protein